MDDDPATLTLSIAAFRAIAAAVTEAEIGGEVPTVTISQLRPDLQLMEDAVGVELTIGDGPTGAGARGSSPAAAASSRSWRIRAKSHRTERGRRRRAAALRTLVACR